MPGLGKRIATGHDRRNGAKHDFEERAVESIPNHRLPNTDGSQLQDTVSSDRTLGFEAVRAKGVAAVIKDAVRATCLDLSILWTGSFRASHDVSASFLPRANP